VIQLTAAALLAFFSCVTTASAAEWREYAYEADGFAISQSAVPILQEEERESPAGPMHVRHYAFFPGPNGVVFMVSAGTLNASDKRTAEEILAFATRNVPEGAIEYLVQSGAKGVQYGYEKDGGSTLIRVLAAGGHQYVLQLNGPASAFPHPDAERWMDSWRLLKPGEKPKGSREIVGVPNGPPTL